MNNQSQSRTFNLEGLLPAHLSDFAPMVSDALHFFVSELSSDRQAEVARLQAQLPESASAADHLVALFHCCPTLHKVGQIIARHRSIDPVTRRALTRLETFPPVTPLSEIRGIIDEDLTARGVQEDVRIAPAALAEASVAVVVPITWHRTPSGPPQRGVLKVRKPGIEARLHEELAILDGLADVLEGLAPQHNAYSIDFRDIFENAKRLLLGEIDFEREQQNLFAAGQQYAHRQDIWIPRLLPFSTSRITAMERIDGVRVTETAGLPAWRRRRIARTIVDAMVAEVVFSRDSDMFFHADPHAGNLFAAEDDCVAILDWSLTGRLEKRDCESIARLLMSAVLLDCSGVCASINSLAISPADPARLVVPVRAALDKIGRGQMPSPSWIVELLDQAVIAGAKFPVHMLLFRKMLLTLQGVISDVCEESSLDAILISKGLAEFWAELPRRALSWPQSRDFATHVSTEQLAHMMSAAPMAAGQYWMRAWSDCLRAFVPSAGC